MKQDSAQKYYEHCSTDTANSGEHWSEYRRVRERVQRNSSANNGLKRTDVARKGSIDARVQI